MKGTSPCAVEFFSKSGASRYCTLSERTLDAARSAGSLPFYRFGSRKVLFKRADLDKWLESMRVDVGSLNAGAP